MCYVFPMTTPEKRPEPEHQGSLWTHPYMVYIWLTLVLFLFLVFVGYLGYTNGWIPDRGISAPSQ
jgi:hypothetical protein